MADHVRLGEEGERSRSVGGAQLGCAAFWGLRAAQHSSSSPPPHRQLLNAKDAAQYAESTYLAYAWTLDDTSFPAQDAASLTGGVYTYSALVNTTWVHGAPTAVNLADSAILQRTTGNAGASITSRTHPLPYTLRQGNLLGSFFALGGAIIIQLAL